MTYLAVDKQVAASTQNVALSALPFLYKEVLHVTLPYVDNIERAKRPMRLSVVFTRDEVKRILANLMGTHHILVTSKRDKHTAKRFFRKLLRAHAKPRVIVTDKLRSYGAALKELLPWTEHRQSRYLNNRAECSHQRTRRRERALQRFKSSRHAQRFLSVFEPLNGHFRTSRHLLTAPNYRQRMRTWFSIWRELTEQRTRA